MVQDVTPQPDGYLFVGPNTRFPIYATVEQSFTLYAGKAKLGKGFTPHSIRHGYASTLLAAKVPITDLAAWLGHRDIRETYGTYGHLVPSAWGAGRQALEDAWAA
jgi:integrase